MLLTLDRVIVAVDDLEAAADDYTRLLGVEPAPAGPDPDRKVRFQLENTGIELVDRKSPALPAPPAAPGVAALAFVLDEDEGEREGEGWLEPSSTRGIPIRLERGGDAAGPAEPRDDADGVTALDHVVISTGDLDAALRLYGERLGLRLALDRSFEKRGIRILFFRIGGITVEVVGPLAGARESEGGADAYAGERDRFGGLAFRVGDVRATRARLAGQRFDVSEERAGHKPGTRVCTLKSDTHGVPTLLIGPDLW